jgi:hypothetical protein
MQNQSIQPISKGMIERILDNLKFRYGRDKDDDIFTILPFGPRGTDLNCWFIIDGPKQDVFKLLCTIDASFSENNLGDAHFACNQYHQENRFGRAIIKEGEREGEYKIYFDTQIDVELGVIEAFLQRLIVMTLYGAHKFYESATKEYGLF